MNKYFKIPTRWCERFELHKWTYKGRSRATIARYCQRCGINAIDYNLMQLRKRRENEAKNQQQ